MTCEDSIYMTRNSYSKMKENKCNTVPKEKKEWVCITNSKAKLLDEKKLTDDTTD